MEASGGGKAHGVGELLDDLVALVASACEAPKRPTAGATPVPAYNVAAAMVIEHKKYLPGSLWFMRGGAVMYTPLLGAVKDGTRLEVKVSASGATRGNYKDLNDFIEDVERILAGVTLV